jgi:hypothetical protein
MRYNYLAKFFIVHSQKKSSKINYSQYVSFISGSLLAISETIPFIDNKYNGILHALSIIQSEYKNNFK